MNSYWVFGIGFGIHLVLALYACLEIKDSFYLSNRQKKPYFVLSIWIPFVGSVVALNRAGRDSGNRKQSSDNIFVSSGSDSSVCSGGDGSGGE